MVIHAVVLCAVVSKGGGGVLMDVVKDDFKGRWRRSWRIDRYINSAENTTVVKRNPFCDNPVMWTPEAI